MGGYGHRPTPPHYPLFKQKDCSQAISVAPIACLCLLSVADDCTLFIPNTSHINMYYMYK